MGPGSRSGGRLWGLFFGGGGAVVGWPGLSGVVGKVARLRSVPDPAYWVLLLVAGLCGLIALSRAGSTLFWRTTGEGSGLRPARRHLVAVPWLRPSSPLMTVYAERLLQLTTAVADQLRATDLYLSPVLGGGAGS